MKDQNPQTRPPLLTLAMIVKDGGQDLASLLAEAAPWVDEIVVGDTGSTDDSKRTATRAGARVIDVPGRDDFAAARNAVLDRCAGSWILTLDADERLAPSDWRALRAWVAEAAGGPADTAGRMTTRNYLPGRHRRRRWQPVPADDPHALPGNWPPAPGFVASAKVRVFPLRPDVRFASRLHETVESSLVAAGCATADLDIPVHHFGSLAEQPAKPEFYLELARLKAADERANPAAWAELADCAITCGLHDEALAAIDRALILDPCHADWRLTAGWLLLQAGRLEQADAQLAGVSGSGGVDDPLLAESCHLRAQIALRLDRTEAAGRLLAIALHLVPDNGHFLNTLGVWHLACGKGDQARVALERACAHLPGQAEPWLNLGRMYAAAGVRDKARESFQQAVALDRRCRPELEALEA